MTLYLRIMKYVRPYWLSLLGSLFCILLFTVFNSASLVTIMPFLETIFVQPDQATADPSAQDSLLSAVPVEKGAFQQLKEQSRQLI